MLKSKSRVFVVEDYHLVRLGLRSDLEDKEGLILVGEADSAESALPRIMSLKPDLVLMDIGLPGMDGIEATRELKKNLPDTKILMLTSHEMENEVLAALSSGANGYCMKDSASYLLEDAIKAVCNGITWIDKQVAGVALKVFEKAQAMGEVENHASEDMRPLSDRERDVLRLMAEGLSNVEIGEQLFVSPHTVKTYVGNILEKLSATDRVQAAVKAVRAGLV